MATQLNSEMIQSKLRDLITEGLIFSDCVAVFSEQNGEYQMALIEAARNQASEGELEVDSDTICSGSSDDGDYVLAWLWVSDEQAVNA